MATPPQERLGVEWNCNAYAPGGIGTGGDDEGEYYPSEADVVRRFTLRTAPLDWIRPNRAT